MPSKSKKKKSKAALEAEQRAKEEEEEARRRAEEEEEKRQRELQKIAEEEERRRKQCREKVFCENEREMSEMKLERDGRFCDEMKVINNEREWRKFLSCPCSFGGSEDDDIETFAGGANFNSNVDVPSLNSFLFENEMPGAEELGSEPETWTETSILQDLCKFCSNVGCIMTKLKIEQLYLKSTTSRRNENASQSESQDSSEVKSIEFLTKCFDLLQMKLDVVTTKYIQKRNSLLLTADGGKSTSSCSNSDFSFGIQLHTPPKENETQSSCVLVGKMILPIGQFSILSSTNSNHGCCIRVASIPFHKFQEKICYNKDKNKDPLIIGNTLYQIDVLELPPIPRQVEKWIINVGTINKKRYSDDGDDTNFNPNGSNLNSISSKIECHIRIPDYIVPSDSLSIMRQDDDDVAGWSIDGISDVKFDFEQKKVFFNLSKSKNIVAITQSRTDDVRYKRWSIGPCEMKIPDAAFCSTDQQSNAVKLLLETPRFDVEIQVIGTYCYLVEPELYQLKDLIRKPCTPEKLLSILSQRFGIHLVPSESDLNCTIKNSEVEDRFCDDMSLLSFAFDIQSSPHNFDLDRSKAMYDIKESDIFTGGRDIFPMHQILMEYDENIGKVSCSIIDPNGLLYEKKESLSSLFTLQDFVNPETLERVKLSSPCTSHTMKRLLKLVNPISCGEKYGIQFGESDSKDHE